MSGLVLALALVLGDTGAALAYLASSATGTASATAGAISGPSSAAAVQSGANVTISWNAATLTGGGAVQGYRVSRSDGTAVCGSPTLVVTLSCTDNSVPSGTYTYTVTAVYHSWTAGATTTAFTVLTAPTISSQPANPSATNSGTFAFNGGNGGGYQCKLDSGSYASCTSPYSSSSLTDGSHTFQVRATSGSSTGPASSYTWTVDTTSPTQTVALASGPSGAYLNAATNVLYYKGGAAGSFSLVDTVSDSGSGAASATFPAIATTGWTHNLETVSTPSGGPYTSSTFSWTAGPSVPGSYTVTGKDAAGNQKTTTLTFSNDSTSPSGAALTVNATAATAAGSSSSTTNNTTFTIGTRTDYIDTGSGLKSSTLTVQSESITGTGTCGAASGPFSTATTITGTTQPSGIQAGYCYVYKLTGIDNVGNTASISTTVIDNALSFQITTQPSSVTAGTAATVKLTAIKNGATDTTYTGLALTWSGANSSPSGVSPTLPTNPTWVAGVASFSITLVKAESETLTVSDGTRSATFTPITVNAGSAAALAWSSVSTTSPAGIPSPCFFACAYASGFGSGKTWTASVSVTDTDGNVVTGLGSGHTVSLAVSGAGGGKGTVAPATVTIAATGAAVSTSTLTYTSPASGTYADTLTASATGYASATATFNK